MKHIISAKQFKDTLILDKVLDLAGHLETSAENGALGEPLRGMVMATLFYEPSTRTRLSFESAMVKLGGSVIGTESAGHFSSVVKGESLRDTIKVVGGYADVIVLRHFEEGSAYEAASVSSVPVINAGDGPGQHPTQALLDMYTIKKELGRLDDLKVAFVGDLMYGRTVHSLAYLLAQRKGVKFFFVSPEDIRMRRDFITHLDGWGVPYLELSNLMEIIREVDVLYVTRIQKERFRSMEDYERIKDVYSINKDVISKMKEKSIIMHPLPRVNELNEEIDDDNRAVYFKQAKNGLYVRMALLTILLKWELDDRNYKIDKYMGSGEQE
ncbi:aspartate carbamoyltransferase [Candidatus Pacearchaeota archaeon]|nr:aspartate carbamoyltransferase [Candidatus Pacearchaeota archaeon]